jgi:hypothetical protein
LNIAMSFQPRKVAHSGGQGQVLQAGVLGARGPSAGYLSQISVTCDLGQASAERIAQGGGCLTGERFDDSAEVALVREAEVGGESCEIALSVSDLLQACARS